MSNYNYEIEKYLAKYGGEADKNITRTCGNCESYDTRLLMCKYADTWDDISIRKPNELSCYHHRTHKENERLQELIAKHQDEADRLRLEEQRKDGTGNCAGCPFKEIRDMMQKVVNLDVLAGYWDVKNNCSLRESIEKLLAKTKDTE